MVLRAIFIYCVRWKKSNISTPNIYKTGFNFIALFLACPQYAFVFLYDQSGNTIGMPILRVAMSSLFKSKYPVLELMPGT